MPGAGPRVPEAAYTSQSGVYRFPERGTSGNQSLEATCTPDWFLPVPHLCADREPVAARTVREGTRGVLRRACLRSPPDSPTLRSGALAGAAACAAPPPDPRPAASRRGALDLAYVAAGRVKIHCVRSHSSERTSRRGRGRSRSRRLPDVAADDEPAERDLPPARRAGPGRRLVRGSRVSCQ